MRARLRGLLSSKALAHGGLTFFLATSAISFLNFVFHVVLSRLMGPSRYGILGALMNVFLVLSVPLAAIQAATAQAEASRTTNGGGGVLVGRAVFRAFLIGIVIAGALMLASPLLRNYLHLRSSLSVIILSVSLIPALVSAILGGVLMGRFRFTPVAVALLAGTGIAKLILGVLLVELGAGVAGAIAAAVIGQIITTVLLMVPLLGELKPSGGRPSGIGLREGVLSILSLVGFWVLASEDMVLSRHFLPSRQAGLYAAAATAGRIALFLPGAIAAIAFPRFSLQNGRGRAAREALRWSMAGTIVLGFSASLVLVLAPNLVVNVLFGSNYLGATGALRILGLESAVLGVVTLLIYFHLARESYQCLYGWAGAVVAFIGIELFHSSMTAIATDMFVSSVVVVVVLAITPIRRLPVEVLS